MIDILALFLLDGLALDDVVLDLVLVVAGLALRLVDGLALHGALALADQRSVAEPGMKVMIKNRIQVTHGLVF